MALVAAAATYLLVPLVRVFAVRIGAMPEVRDRDVHTTPTPRLGGLAMYGGLVAGLLIAGKLPYAGGKLAAEGDGKTVIALIVAGGIITVTGFLDDWWGMDALIKLAGQVGAAGVLVAFGVSLPWLPWPSSLGGTVVLDPTLGALITIMIVVVMINAVNFVDGLDGLAAGIVGIAAMATWTYSVALSRDFGDTSINVTAAITSVLIGVCLGFLPHNFHPAKIFMGDTGAMLIGLVLASTMITVTPLETSSINSFPVILPLLVPVAILVLPLLDLVMAVIRRTSKGLSPFAPDRGHLHHRLLDIGHSHRRSVLIMYAWTFLFAFAVVALSIEGVPLILFPLTVLLAVGVLVMMALPRWRARRDVVGVAGAGEPGADPATTAATSAATTPSQAPRQPAAPGHPDDRASFGREAPGGPAGARPAPGRPAPGGGGADHPGSGRPPADRLVAGRPPADRLVAGRPPADHSAAGRPPVGGRSIFERPADRPAPNRPVDRPAPDWPPADRPASGRPPASRPAGGRSPADRPASDWPPADRTAAGWPAADRAASGRPASGLPPADRPVPDRPADQARPDRRDRPADGPPQVRPHPYPPEDPAARPVVGDDATKVSGLPDLSLSAPRPGFSNPETPI